MAETDIPVVVTAAGAQPTPPATLLATLLANVSASTPGYTATLPASLIEDVSSTDVGALVMIDQARVEAINSSTPYGSNDFVLSQLGQIYIGPGSAPAIPSNTSVFVVFTATDENTDAPLPGFPVNVGFTVSDGVYQYIVQDGGVTASDGVTEPLFCQATIAGSWAVPTQSVSQLVTQPPTGVDLSCTNLTPGISGGPAETAAQYRARVLTAGQAVATGTTALLKTLLGQVTGVQQRLVSVIQNAGGGWIVIVGGGDPYLTAGAINKSGLDISTLVGATLAVSNITQANPGVVTTSTNHNLVTGAAIKMSGILGMTELNGEQVTVTVVDEKHFSVGVNTSGFPAYAGGGIVNPNPINVTVNIPDAPNVYGITFVDPPSQTVAVTATYNTTQPNFTSQAAVAQAAAPAIAAYINGIQAGAPMSDLVLGTVFAAAWTAATNLDPSLISSLTFAVSINGVPTAGVGEYFIGDPYSYFTTTSAQITVEQS